MDYERQVAVAIVALILASFTAWFGLSSTNPSWKECVFPTALVIFAGITLWGIQLYWGILLLVSLTLLVLAYLIQKFRPIDTHTQWLSVFIGCIFTGGFLIWLAVELAFHWKINPASPVLFGVAILTLGYTLQRRRFNWRMYPRPVIGFFVFFVGLTAFIQMIRI